MFSLDDFIARFVIERSESLFASDIEKNKFDLQTKIENKSMLVIGGAGSIGSSFIKNCLCYKPKTLVVVDTNENALAELTRDLRSSGSFVPNDFVPYPMSYSSSVFEKMFRHRRGFDIVANFSAHKHVRSEKDIFSVQALLENNVLHLKKMLDLLSEFPPENYFCVSTDKAANPVNIMGASKRIMEEVIFAYSENFPVKTARFANVAFSNGSLPYGFFERFSKLQPISAPNDVKRYFVSPKESGEICMLSCMLGNNREIFFPKLQKESMKTFSEIAENFLREHGVEIVYCESDKDAIKKSIELKQGCKKYPVYFSASDTTGEKDAEEFFASDEELDTNRFLSLGVIKNKKLRPISEIENLFLQLENAFKNENATKETIVKILHDFLPNFAHRELGKNLDGKM